MSSSYPFAPWALNGNASSRSSVASDSSGLDPRELINAVFYLVKSGCQWRTLLDEFPPWRAAHYHFRKWREMNLLQRLMGRIRRAVRVAAGRDPSPSAAAGDTQSARAERQGGPGRGRDPNKQVTGRKRHVIACALGLLLAVVVHPANEVVHPANENDAQSAPSVPGQLLGQGRTPEGNLRR